MGPTGATGPSGGDVGPTGATGATGPAGDAYYSFTTLRSNNALGPFPADTPYNIVFDEVQVTNATILFNGANRAQFTVSVTGYYLVAFNVAVCQGTVSGELCTVYLNTGASATNVQFYGTLGATPAPISGTCVARLTAGSFYSITVDCAVPFKFNQTPYATLAITYLAPGP